MLYAICYIRMFSRLLTPDLTLGGGGGARARARILAYTELDAQDKWCKWCKS